MSCRSFHDAIDAAFHSVAVEVDGAEGKAIHQPGVQGLHVFLEGCRGDAPGNDVSEDAAANAFSIQIRTVLATMLGIRMCPRCPHSSDSPSPCQDALGSNAEAMGGIAGRVDALFGAVIAAQAFKLIWKGQGSRRQPRVHITRVPYGIIHGRIGQPEPGSQQRVRH